MKPSVSETAPASPATGASAFSRPVLCAVLDVSAFHDAPRQTAQALFAAGVDWIQIRDRSATGEQLEATAAGVAAARDAAQKAEREGAAAAPRVFVNKRADIAWATGADGVHLGGDALSVKHAGQLLPGALLLGASFHSENEISEALGGRTASDSPLHYGHLAPIWDPRSKPAERPALGLDRLATAAALGLPLIAQGGLDAERAGQAISAGAAGIAVTGLLTLAADPPAVARDLRAALDRAAPQDG
ncbi:MAG: thiamine phosphate synthase [Myxococcota bacterium]